MITQLKQLPINIISNIIIICFVNILKRSYHMNRLGGEFLIKDQIIGEHIKKSLNHYKGLNKDKHNLSFIWKKFFSIHGSGNGAFSNFAKSTKLLINKSI